MNDTPVDVYQLQVRIWQAKPFAERIRLGAAADMLGLNAAAAVVGRELNGDPAALFLRLHGSEFDPPVRDHIAAAIRRHVLARTSA